MLPSQAPTASDSAETCDFKETGNSEKYCGTGDSDDSGKFADSDEYSDFDQFGDSCEYNNFDDSEESGDSAEFADIALCVFEKRGPKMFNFELLFLHGFSSKNCEILNKAVLTPQEYNDYFFWKKN